MGWRLPRDMPALTTGDRFNAEIRRDPARSAFAMTGFDPRAAARETVSQGKVNGARPPPRTITTIDFASMPEVEPPPRRFVVGGWLPVPPVELLRRTRHRQIHDCPAAGYLCRCRSRVFRCAVARSPVLGIFGEDDSEELQRRQWRINQACGLKFADLADLHLEGAAGLDNMLCGFPGGAPNIGPLYEPLIAKANSQGPDHPRQSRTDVSRQRERPFAGHL